ncbi:MAG: helix-turn-helix transcriptional regulator [Moorellaceae bacterium]
MATNSWRKKEIPGPTPGRNSFARIYAIHRWIAGRFYPSVAFLAEHLEVSRRTVERDLETMRDFFGAPIAYDRSHKGYYYEGPFNLPPVRLTEGELLVLYLGQKLLNQIGGTPFGQVMRSALDKIKAMLPERVNLDPTLMEESISFGVDPLRGDEKHLVAVYADLVQAVHECRSVQITYYTASRDAVTERLIDPYHLRFYRGAWYVVAYCHLRQEVRLFALDRIRQWKLTTAQFTIQPDFSLEEYLRDSLGIERGEQTREVVIRFAASQVRWIQERKWHSSQQSELLPDGSLIIRMYLSGLQEVKRWVLSFGGCAEVLAPPELRQEMIQEVQALKEIYNTGE